MTIRSQFDNTRIDANIKENRGWQTSCRMMLDQFLNSSSAHSRSAPHIRDTTSVQGILNNYVIATLPCWLLGLWNLGYQLNAAMVTMELTDASGWRGTILRSSGIGNDPNNILACWMHGFLYFLPLFIVALLVSAWWDVVFAQIRRRPLDEGVLVFAWLFTLLLPAGAPLYQAGLGMSFGVVIGKHIFGGTGRYLVNPAVLGAVFLWLAYPDLVFGETTWVPILGFVHTSVLEMAAAGGTDAILASGTSWWDLFLGIRPGPIGMTSALGCLLGAAYLVLTGTASWRVLAGFMLAAVATVFVFNSLETSNNVLAITWHWQLLLTGMVFGAVFLATDPVAGATTNPGRWVFGALVAVLALIIQATNPAINQAILFAVFLASLSAPIIDFIVVELYHRRRRQRARALDHG